MQQSPLSRHCPATVAHCLNCEVLSLSAFYQPGNNPYEPFKRFNHLKPSKNKFVVGKTFCPSTILPLHLHLEPQETLPLYTLDPYNPYLYPSGLLRWQMFGLA